MKLSNSLIVISLTIVCYAMIIGITPELNDFQVWLPFLLCLLYFIVVFSYAYLYKRNLNNKLTNPNVRKLPESRIISISSTIGFMLLIVVYASWFTIPIILYPEEEYEIEVSTNVEEIVFEDLITEIFDLVNADTNTLYIDEYFSFTIDKSKTISKLHFSFDIDRDDSRIHFECDYKDGVLTVSHTKGMNNYIFSYKGEHTEGDSFTYYDEINYDDLLAYYLLEDNEFIVITGSSGYAETDEYLISPNSDVKVHLNQINGTESFITEQTIYNDNDYFFITTREMETPSPDTHIYKDQKYIYIIQK